MTELGPDSQGGSLSLRRRDKCNDSNDRLSPAQVTLIWSQSHKTFLSKFTQS
jgi:hypothetical protein